MGRRILIVDDEDTLCEALRFNLEAAGYDATAVHSAEEALESDIASFDLILLDIMMDGMSGLQLARILRRNSATANVPIIFCTAKDAEEDMLEGFNTGGDDYIAKPYSMRNVLARVEAILRRTSRKEQASPNPENVITYQGLQLFPDQKRCEVDGIEVRLPRKEFEILLLLLKNRGRVFSRAELLSTVWPDKVVVLDRVVDVNITRIRHKIGQYGSNILTRSGYGYVFMD